MSTTCPRFPWHSQMVGVSESTHWLCQEFLATLCLRFPSMRVHVSFCHGKLTRGWTLPPEAPPEVADAMKKRVQDEFHEVIAKSIAGRRSDFIHLNPGPDRGGNMWRLVCHTNTVSIAFLQYQIHPCVDCVLKPRPASCSHHYLVLSLLLSLLLLLLSHE